MRIHTSLFASVALVSVTLVPLAAHAVGTPEVSTSGKGIVGGTLLGAEVVLATEAAFKVQPTWAYIVGGLAGGAAGGIGGYFVEHNGNPRTTMFLLAGGMALAIPTTVAVLSATAYEPPADYLQDKAPVDEPVAEPPQPGSQPAPTAAPVEPPPTPAPSAPAAPGAAPAPATAPTSVLPRHRKLARRAPAPLDYHLSPPALIGISSQALTLGVPALELRDVYSRSEVAMYGVSQATEVRVPVLNFLF